MCVPQNNNPAMPEKNNNEETEKKVRALFQQAMKGYSLVEDGDNVLVGLSGGKDSLCLTELLARRARIYKPRFSVVAAHIRMENVSYETDTSYIQQFADSLDIPLHIITTRFDRRDDTKPVCFLCSWYRRKALFNIAQETRCNKLALGHHKDDILHTALLNTFFEGRFATMPAKLSMRKMPITIIRPLCLLDEADIKDFAAAKGYKKQIKTCPYEHASKRSAARRLLSLIQDECPDARSCLFHALDADGKLVQ